MAIHIYLPAKRKAKDAPEDDGQILAIQNKYNCSRMDAARRYYSGERVKDGAPTDADKKSRAARLARLFGIPVANAIKELEAEEWDEEEAATNIRGGYARHLAKKAKDSELIGKVVLHEGKWWYRKPNDSVRYGPFTSASEAAASARKAGVTVDAFEENKHPRAKNGEFGSGGGKKTETKKNPPHVEAHTIPELKPLVEAYNKALKEFRAGVAHGNEILAKTHNVAEKNAYLAPLQKKMDQAERAANKATKAYSQKTGVNVELTGFNGPGISKYN